jgi:hypothetical protein
LGSRPLAAGSRGWEWGLARVSLDFVAGDRCVHADTSPACLDLEWKIARSQDAHQEKAVVERKIVVLLSVVVDDT